MNMILRIIILLLIEQYSFGQNKSQIDSSLLKRISNQIKKEILNSYKNDTITIDDNCYYGTINGEKRYLSCFDVEWNLKWVGDINKDGEDDIILKVTDDGEGGGGNLEAYDYLILCLKDKQIIKRDTIFGGSDFSSGRIEIDSVSNNTIFATLDEHNYKAFILDDIDSDKDNISLQFVYKNDKLGVNSYSNCPLRGVDKRIFKPELSNVKRNCQLNEMYEDCQLETYKVNDKEVISAFLYGCQYIKLSFIIPFPYNRKVETDSLFSKKEVLKKLDFLKTNTRFEELFLALHCQIEKSGFEGDHSSIMTNGWKYFISIENYDYNNTSYLTIELFGKYQGKF